MMKDIARGAAWMIAFRFVERGLGLISVLILARLLLPEDFGLVAIAMSVVALIELAGAFSFDVALIQHRDPKDEHFNTVFTMNVLVGLGGGLVLAALAHVTALYFNDNRLIEIMYVLAVAWVIQGFENVGPVMFRRNMDFRREFQFLLSKRLLTFVTTLVAAFTLRNYWALVIGIVTGRVAMLVLSYAMHPYRPRFSLAAARELMSFSAWLFLGNILGFFILRLSTFVIGRLDSPRGVGHYTVAYEIGTLPTSELLAPINRAIIPGFARMATDAATLRSGFLDVVAATTLFVVPAAFGIAVVAEPLVRVMLTDRWIDIVPLLQVLGILGAVAAILSSAFPAFYALGRPRIAVYILAFRLALLLPAMIAATAAYGVLGAAWADLATALLALPVSMILACRVLEVPLPDLLRRIWRPFLASLSMYYLVQLFLEWLAAGQSEMRPVLLLAASVAIGILVYGIVLFLLWRLSGREPGIETRLLAMIGRRKP